MILNLELRKQMIQFSHKIDVNWEGGWTQSVNLKWLGGKAKNRLI